VPISLPRRQDNAEPDKPLVSRGFSFLPANATAAPSCGSPYTVARLAVCFIGMICVWCEERLDLDHHLSRVGAFVRFGTNVVLIGKETLR
jgi:hypothetical protein